ncbi:MAG TPA: hypothetical protein DEA97_02510 [Bacteroidales bacterium]|nr:hypothetical protein [Bacteroidales bacterium]
MKHFFSLAIVLFFAMINLFSQDPQEKLNSLKKQLESAKHDTTRAMIYLDMGDVFEESNPDSCIYYYLKAKNLASTSQANNGKSVVSGRLDILAATGERYIGLIYNRIGEYDKAFESFKKAIVILEKLKKSAFKDISTDAHKELAPAYYNTGTTLSNKGDFKPAMEYFKKSLEVSKKFDNKRGQNMCYTYIGSTYSDLGDYKLALENYLKALKIAEEIEDYEGVAYILNNIGNIHSLQGDFDKALTYFQKSLAISKKYNFLQGEYYANANIGSVYNEKKMYDKALVNYFECLKIIEGVGDKYGTAEICNNIAELYLDTKQFKKATEYFTRALSLHEEIGNKDGASSLYGNLANLYGAMADSTGISSSEKRNLYLKALEFGEKAYTIALETGSPRRKGEAAKVLMTAYKFTGNVSKALNYAEIYIEARDSMYTEEKANALAEMDTKYQTEKKQLENEKLKNEKLLDDELIKTQSLENKRQQTVIFSVIGGLVLLLVILFIIFRMFRQKRQANIDLEMKNEEISAQRDEIEAQRNLAADQRDLISEQKQEITDSIHYAFRIQSAVIPDIAILNHVVSDSFILHMPRDIVSGDFYWIGEQDNKIIILAADCTGHGVPGAFMSMLGIAFLNEIVSKENITSPAEILNELRNKIVKALKQQGKSGEQKDGMDISVITIDPTHNHLQFSGANNPLYLIRNNDLVEIKGDKMPVAIHDKMESFVNHEMAINKGDNIYIFTDGFADQFGGPQGKKFKYKPFKELLVKNTHLPLTGQQALLKETFVNWKGSLDQVDDVLVIGIKI